MQLAQQHPFAVLVSGGRCPLKNSASLPVSHAAPFFPFSGSGCGSFFEDPHLWCALRFSFKPPEGSLKTRSREAVEHGSRAQHAGTMGRERHMARFTGFFWLAAKKKKRHTGFSRVLMFETHAESFPRAKRRDLTKRMSRWTWTFSKPSQQARTHAC